MFHFPKTHSAFDKHDAIHYWEYKDDMGRDRCGECGISRNPEVQHKHDLAEIRRRSFAKRGDAFKRLADL